MSLIATTKLLRPVKVSNSYLLCSLATRLIFSCTAWSLDCEEVQRSFEQVLNLLLRSSRSLPEDRRKVRDQPEWVWQPWVT